MTWFQRRRRREAELDEEIQGHLTMAARDREAAGESPREAAYAARREFGNATLVKEVTRQSWGGVWLEQLVQDVRMAVRSSLRTPAFTLAVVALLGLGLGGAAAMYGILDRLLLRPPEAVRDPGGLYSPYITAVGGFGAGDVSSGTMQWRDYRLLTEGVEAISAAAAFAGPESEQLTLGTVQVEARLVMASASYFDLLGVRPALGRFFSPVDSVASETPAAVLSYGFWQHRFGGARDVVGKTIAKGGVIYAVVGVAPRGFSGVTPERVDLWLPAERAAPINNPDWQVNSFFWQVLARPRPGRTAAQACAEGLIRLRAAPPDPHYRFGGEYRAVHAGSIVPGRTPSLSSGLRLTFIVGGASAVVALIAITNALVLLLLRALRRQRETAMRLVLGIPRVRLLRSVAIESALLAGLAGFAAALVAAVGGEVLRKLVLRVDWAVPVVDPRVALVTLGACLVIGLTVGIVPGWLAGRPETVAALKSGMRQTGLRRARGRAVLLSLEAGLSLTLLAGLALYVRSFQRARAFNFGPDVDHVLVAELQDRTPDWPTRRIGRDVTDPILASVSRLPGVEAVAFASATPLWSFTMTLVRAEGVDSFPGHGVHGPSVVEVGPGYFRAAGMSLLRGRDLRDGMPNGYPEAVVSRALAGSWPDGTAIGRCLYIGREPVPCTRIAGVVADLHSSLRDPAPFMTIYVPLSAGPRNFGPRSLIVRAARPARLVPAVREIVQGVAGVRSPDAVRTLRDVVDPQFVRLRQGTQLFGIFAVLAVVVAIFGMYSVVRYSVAQRAHEFGVRVALGAGSGNLVLLVLGQALGYAAAGLVFGVILSLLGGRYVAPLLYDTSARDPLALSAAALALLVAALIASLAPAWAAAHADPRQALQAE